LSWKSARFTGRARRLLCASEGGQVRCVVLVMGFCSCGKSVLFIVTSRAICEVTLLEGTTTFSFGSARLRPSPLYEEDLLVGESKHSRQK